MNNSNSAIFTFLVGNTNTFNQSPKESSSLSMELDKSKSDDNVTKKANLKFRLIRLTELSSEERNKWMEKSEIITNSEGDLTLPLIPRYYMRARPESTNTWPKRSKRRPANYSDNPKTDKDMDSDFELVLPGPPPLDNKHFPSANRIAMQQEILNNKRYPLGEEKSFGRYIRFTFGTANTNSNVRN